MKYSIRALMSLLAICVFSNINAQCDDSVLDCPTVLAVYENDAGVCGADIVIDDPLSNDTDCVIDDIVNDFNNSNDASDFYPVGSTDVVFTVTFLSGEMAMCSITIDVDDTEAPVFDSAPPAIDPIACDDPLPEHIELTATDNCGVSLIEMDTIPFIPTCGDYEITYVWTASDPDGNESSTMVTFTVMADTEAPVFDADPVDLSAMSIACDEDLLETETLSATDDCNGLAITVDTTIVGTVCQGMIVTYTWTATDDCLNEAEVSTNYAIDPETRLPEIIIPADPLEFCNDPMLCEATIVVPEPEVNGFCAEVTNISFTRADGLANTDPFPVGINTITWTATNECNTVSMAADQIIEILDCEGPLLSCNNDVCINLSADGTALVTHDHIIIQPVSDNCGGIITQTVQRMDDPCGIDGNTEPGPDVTVCCDDLGDEVMVLAVITDQYGNPSSCMVSVEVKLTLNPVVTCPEDVTVSCEFPIDEEDLFVFGTLNDGMDNAMIITLDDPAIDPDPTLMDGYFTSPCPEDAEVDESIDDQRECNQGLIVRTLTVTDLEGNMGSCNQQIMVVDQAPFDENDITWPEDVEINFDNCIAETDPEDLPGPTFTSDNCSLIAVSTEDLIYDEPNSGCFIIERRFTVLDWCQYESMADPEVGVWRDTQFITMVNNVAPVFDQACPDTLVVCIDSETCLAMTDITFGATDDCTDDEDIAYTYGIDTDGDDVLDAFGNTNAYSGILDIGFYPISWTADDQCGNVISCSYVLSVKDCKAPTAACKFGLAANLNEMIIDGDTIPMVMAPIDIFDASSTDECTSISLSFSSDIDSIVSTFTCENLGLNSVQLWVTDSCGNQSFCETYIDIQDNYSLCPTPIFSRVSGSLFTENQKEITNVMVDLSSDKMEEENMTDEAGAFLFEDVPMYDNYMLTASNDIDHTNGISTLDIIIIQRHILGIEDLSSPYKLIAADVNKSKNITALDLAELRKLILGIYQELPESESWVFIDAEQAFANEMEPWNYNEYHALEDLDYHALDMDFIGLKVGDVNNSVVFNAKDDTETRTQAFSMQKFAKDVGLILKADQDITTFGLQFSFYVSHPEMLSFNSDFFEAEDVFVAYNEELQEMNISIASSKAIEIEKGQEILTITGLNDLSLTPSLNAEIYNQDFEVLNLDLSTYESTEENVYIHQNVPNPFTDATSIDIELSTSDQYQIQIHNAIGQLVFQETTLFYAGKHTISIDEKMLKGQYGVLVVSVQNEHVRLSKKMTRVR